MDYPLSKKTLSLSETVFEGSAEQPLDIDFTLPDYCPDIQRILKCQVYPKIYSRNISGDRLDVDGAAVVKILYVDAVKKSVRCSEHTLPYTCSFSLKTTPQNAVIEAQAKPEYLNCRAISPRRLDIHGAFTVRVRVICRCEKELICKIDGDDVQMKKAAYPVSTVTGSAQQLFSVTEDIELSGSKPPLEAVLRTEATAILTDCKTITNKMMVKGDLNLKLLYLTDLDSGNVEVMDYTLPISRILDVDGAEENALCNASINLLNYDIKVRSDLSDNNTVITLEAKLAVTAETYGSEEAQVITDAYSTLYDLDLVFGQTALSNLHTVISDSCITKSTVEASQSGVTRVIDLWAEQCSCKALVENGQIVIAGKVNICILAIDNDSAPFYTERTTDFSYPLSIDGDVLKLTASPAAQVLSLSYRLNGANNIEVRTEIKVTAVVFENVSVRTVTSASADEEHLRKKDNNVAITLYYADKGEKVWDIARAYCVCCDNIKAENDLTDDIVPTGKMLLIPNI